MRIEYTGQFKKDLKLAKKRGKDIRKIKLLMSFLVEKKPLPESCVDHPLIGSWKGCRDLHIEPDWLLIYRIDKSFLRFERTGSHSDLF